MSFTDYFQKAVFLTDEMLPDDAPLPKTGWTASFYQGKAVACLWTKKPANKMKMCPHNGHKISRITR